MGPEATQQGSPPSSGQTKGHSILIWNEPKTGNEQRKGQGYGDVYTARREGRAGEGRGAFETMQDNTIHHLLSQFKFFCPLQEYGVDDEVHSDNCEPKDHSPICRGSGKRE